MQESSNFIVVLMLYRLSFGGSHKFRYEWVPNCTYKLIVRQYLFINWSVYTTNFTIKQIKHCCAKKKTYVGTVVFNLFYCKSCCVD
jgi:hypothetical protein